MSSYIFHIYIFVYSCGFVPLIKGLLIFQVKFNFSPINNNSSKNKRQQKRILKHRGTLMRITKVLCFKWKYNIFYSEQLIYSAINSVIWKNNKTLRKCQYRRHSHTRYISHIFSLPVCVCFFVRNSLRSTKSLTAIENVNSYWQPCVLLSSSAAAISQALVRPVLGRHKATQSTLSPLVSSILVLSLWAWWLQVKQLNIWPSERRTSDRDLYHLTFFNSKTFGLHI